MIVSKTGKAHVEAPVMELRRRFAAPCKNPAPLWALGALHFVYRRPYTYTRG